MIWMQKQSDPVDQTDQVNHLKNIIAELSNVWKPGRSSATEQELLLLNKNYSIVDPLLWPITYIYVSYLAEHSSLRKGRVSQPFIF